MMLEKTGYDIRILVGRWLSVCLMICCLTFLTSINYFIYPSDTVCSGHSFGDSEGSDNNNNFPPSGPTEEKSSGSSLTISEEMLHEIHPEVNFQATNLFYLHHIAETEKIEIFHPEILLPPPKA